MSSLLEASGISVSFGGVRAVSEVDLRLDDGQCVGIIGPNGSGKTTFLNAVCGIVPASGRLLVEGRPIRLGRPKQARWAGILRVFQAPQIYDNLTCIENVMLATDDRRGTGLFGGVLGRRSMIRRERARVEVGVEALRGVGLLPMAEQSAARLSYGQRRLLEIARALSADPKILLLDEPSAGLNDAETRSLGDLLERLQGEGQAMVLVDHKVDFVDRICPRIMAMELGEKIAEGVPAEVWTNPRVADAYLGAVGDA
ncbi:MAG TPA: ATP-binding cassette domain-containing protein [Acidimicrobiales bacterium]|nr:ATP-binding cassette domain-containing protein [Acidimicrobiales bacterium]